MKKSGLDIFLIILLFSLAISVFVVAKPDTTLVPAINNKAEVDVIIPAHAVQVADGVFSLGHALDVDGRVVEGFMFVHDKRENAKPPWAGGGKGNGESKCYSFLAKGARWKTTEQYITGEGVDTTITETSLNTWDSEVAFDIFGTRNINEVTDGADDVNPDGKNEVELKNIGSSNTIAYTIVWGVFSGPLSSRELVEWDTVFNTHYPFGDATINPEVMDYQNVGTHEFGHALGLGHPDNSCAEETMYAYADFGETKKRTLESGDIAGVNKLY